MNFESSSSPSSPSSSSSSLQKWVPSQSPQTWIVINTVCFVYSLVLSIYIVKALRDSGERPSVGALYLIWNFGTTIVWCFEAGLETRWNYQTMVSYTVHGTSTTVVGHEHEDDFSPSDSGASGAESWWRSWWRSCWSWSAANLDYIANLMELLVAVYFSIGSAVLLWNWKIRVQDVSETLVDVTTNLVFYFYAMIRDFVRLHNNNTTRSGGRESENGLYMQID